jgi:predicted dehydrogenase
MTQPVRIGFVGAGGIVQSRHIPNLQNIAGVELVSVCNRSQESGERVAQAFGLRKVFTDWHDVVHDPDIDVVWIGTAA